MNCGFALFDTAIGRCGLAWGPRGVLRVQLPEASETATRARLSALLPEAREATPPAPVKRAIGRIVASLGGGANDLSAVSLDFEDLPAFHRLVYEETRRIPAGETLSYGEVASRLGRPGAARAVGQALGRNPFAIVVPCHRVLAAGGKTGGFSANGGVSTKLRLLAIEGAQLKPSGGAPAPHSGFAFDTRQAVAELSAADPAFGRLIERVGPFRMQLKATPNLFGALAESIVYQQLSGKAAATIFARVCAALPRTRGGPSAEELLKAPEAALRAAGLSGAKWRALRDLAEKTVARQLPTLAEVQRMSNEGIIEKLTQVRGIGRWTVEMLLMFRLGRPDVLPLDDLGIRKGFAAAFKRTELPTSRELDQRGARWKPFRTVASWYLWRASEL